MVSLYRSRIMNMGAYLQWEQIFKRRNSKCYSHWQRKSVMGLSVRTFCVDNHESWFNGRKCTGNNYKCLNMFCACDMCLLQCKWQKWANFSDCANVRIINFRLLYEHFYQFQLESQMMYKYIRLHMNHIQCYNNDECLFISMPCYKLHYLEEIDREERGGEKENSNCKNKFTRMK